MILPSQARDKHEENSKKKGVSLGLNLAIDGRVVSLVKNSQATRQSWLAANCHTCDCPGRSLCTCESGKALQVISVGREDTANVNERAVLVETITAHIQAERENRCMKARLRFRVVRPPSLKEKATWQQTSPMGSSSRGGSTGQRGTPLPSGEQQQQQQKEEKEENDHDKEKVTPRTAAARVAELEAENAALRMDRQRLLQEVETLRLLSPSLSSGGPGSNNTSPTRSGGSSPGGGGGGNYNYTPLLPSSARQQQPQQQPSSSSPSSSSITPASESGRKSTTETSPATNSTQRASTPSSPSSLSPSLSLSAGGSAGGRPSGGGRSRPRRLVSTNRFRQSDSLEASSSPG
jgi:hypothetical protein